jgi:transcriptional regulator with XRE-family HTH domain
MEWRQIREHYRRALGVARSHGRLTQVDVARAGRTAQNQISKLLNSKDTSRGPTVVNFLKALDGLGVPASVFFAELERRHPDPRRPLVIPPTTPPAPDTEAELERAIGRYVLYAIRLAVSPRKP